MWENISTIGHEAAVMSGANASYFYAKSRELYIALESAKRFVLEAEVCNPLIDFARARAILDCYVPLEIWSR